MQLVYIAHKGDKLADVIAAHDSIDRVVSIRAGKFRRYHGEGWRQIFHIITLLKNIRDFFWVIAGTLQSYWQLGRIKPAAIFIKGGFVGLPVGWAATARKIPYVTHDSDAIPGLTNRLLAKRAAMHAVALPADTYPYPKEKTQTVGVPLSSDYQPVTAVLQREYRRGLNIVEDSKVLCVTGGGLGAQRLNRAVAESLPALFKRYPELVVLHLTGRDHEAEIKNYYKTHLKEDEQKQVIVKGFVNDLYRYSAAADIIICRAGATNLAEFAMQRRPIVIVPNPNLTGGHQTKNAELLAKAGAATVISETQLAQQPNSLATVVGDLFHYAGKRQELGEKLGAFAQPDAARELAKLILQVSK